MQRIQIQARPNWKETVEETGLLWSTTEEGAYWSEAMTQPVYYHFTPEEQFQLEAAGNELHEMCLRSLTWLLEEAPVEDYNYWMAAYGISPEVAKIIQLSWDMDHWAVYGRFDFLMTADGLKLLEYNADTPTTLLESSISQWNWYKENVDRGALPRHMNQFNEIHESLVRHWGDMRENGLYGKVHFASLDPTDDVVTTMYMAETAAEAGHDVEYVDIEAIGIRDERQYIDAEGKDIRNIFALYPKEWMVTDEGFNTISKSSTRWMEPWWKMLLSNKALLALLWELYPDHPLLVPTYMNRDDIELRDGDKWVTKPILSREGQNVRIWECDPFLNMNLVSGDNDGEYSDCPIIYQKFIEGEKHDGCLPLLGVWMVGEDAVGLGIRESDTLITQNNSRFIPHCFG